jgi:hypothetical protein
VRFVNVNVADFGTASSRDQVVADADATLGP